MDVQAGGRCLQNMISDLLIYSRVGTRGKEFAPVNCEDVLKEVLGSLQIAIEESAATWVESLGGFPYSGRGEFSRPKKQFNLRKKGNE